MNSSWAKYSKNQNKEVKTSETLFRAFVTRACKPLRIQVKTQRVDFCSVCAPPKFLERPARHVSSVEDPDDSSLSVAHWVGQQRMSEQVEKEKTFSEAVARRVPSKLSANAANEVSCASIIFVFLESYNSIRT